MAIYYLVNLTKYLLCAASMILTALFALTLSAKSNFGLPFHFPGEGYLLIALATIIGVSIDLSKYLFWQVSGRITLRSISLLLVFFSWLASVAFFMSQNAATEEQKRKATAAYSSHQAEIQAFKMEVEGKKALIDKRLGSRYHNQWDKGEELLDELKAANFRLESLLADSHKIGLEDARKEMVSSTIFIKLSDISDFEVSTIQFTFYGILALLIEICSLGAISLSKYYSYGMFATETNEAPDQQPKATIIEKKQKLKKDIIKGVVRPVFRDIHKGRYGLSRDAIIEVLSSLQEEGALVADTRNSFKLADAEVESK